LRGLLIAVCGLDGSGKTTQIKLLEEWFRVNDKAVMLTRQPSDYYRNDERVRTFLDFGHCPDMRVLALLSAADRKWSMATVVEPALTQGTSVISDRFLYSTLAYFSVRGLPLDYVIQLNEGVQKPDITVFLDIEPEETLDRVKARDGETLKYEERDATTFVQVREAFKAVLPQDALIIDAQRDILSIHEEIVSAINCKLPSNKVVTGSQI
jgi:dTMP kinase